MKVLFGFAIALSFFSNTDAEARGLTHAESKVLFKNLGAEGIGAQVKAVGDVAYYRVVAVSCMSGMTLSCRMNDANRENVELRAVAGKTASVIQSAIIIALELKKPQMGKPIEASQIKCVAMPDPKQKKKIVYTCDVQPVMT